MKLVIGGAYQGKQNYVQEYYGVRENWADGRDCPMEAIEACSVMAYFHEYVKRMIHDPQDGYGFQMDSLVSLEEQAEKFVKKITEKNPELILVTNELGCGVVPIEKTDRLWREAVGRICTCLAREAEEVVRVICGVGVKIK